MLLFLLLLSAAQDPSVVCVATRAVDETARAASARELASATAARIDDTGVVVRPCGSPTDEAKWRVDAAFATGAVALKITGEGLDVERLLDTEGRPAHESLQLVALTIAEAVRPAIESTQQEDPKPNPTVVNTAERDVSAQSAIVAAMLGGAWGIDSSELSPALSVDASWSFAGWRIGPAFALQRIGRSRNRFEVSGWTAAGGLQVGMRENWWEFSGLLLGRWTSFRTQADELQFRSASHADLGGGATLGWWPLRWSWLEAGVRTTAMLWVWPRRIRLGEKTAYEQSLVELWAGPSISVLAP